MSCLFVVTLRLYGSGVFEEDDDETTLVVHPCSVMDVVHKYILRSSNQKIKEMGKAGIEVLKQTWNQIWVAYQSFDGDAAGDGAAVELDAVVAGPSTLTFRPRVADADAVLVVAYAHAPLGKGVDVEAIFAEIPLANTAPLEHHSCFRFVMRLAQKIDDLRPLTESRPDTFDFFVMSGYSLQDMTQATSSIIPDYAAGRYEEVDASAKVSDVVESQRGRRRCHVLLVHAARKSPSVSRDGAPKRARPASAFYALDTRPALEKEGVSLGEIGPPPRPI